ncbi:Zinc-regulated transporter [Lachnellula subtilissima]|uniref:Zinc-regulated transporter n=1 Tax=Lachnellula subtilissima TaxID=602034 RepID=A0A8H8RPB3_9HELO|nr:Zinc-regulated transporter [Lachnellula subtilissima]
MPYTVTIDCDNGNGYDGRIGVRISSIFVIGLGSMLGALLPIAAARTKRMRVPPLAFFITKYFGSGVIISTAFIHLLSPANKALNSPCNTGLITNYDWAAGTALMTIFLMFFIELMAARFDVFGAHAHDLEATDPAKDLIKAAEKPKDGKSNVHKVFTDTHSHSNGTLESSPDSINTDNELGIIPVTAGPSRPSSPVPAEPFRTRSSIPGRVNDLSYPPGGEDHLGHQREHMVDHDHFAAQMTALFILEFGVIFHSVFIGLTLAVTGDEFNVLYIVLAFHQTFEGLGLGSRLATAEWPKKKSWMPWALGFAYGMATPLAIAIGLGVRQTFTPNSQKTRVVNGVFDAISAGILIYTGLVELMAHEFMFNPEMRKSSIKMMLLAFLCMCVGAGLMALLGKWA